MPDTRRTETDLLTNLFQDSQTDGSISAQDVRDYIVSVFSRQTRKETTTPITVTVDNYTILMDATAAAATVNLYTAVGNPGRRITIKKIDSSANTVTIDGTTTETIDGVLTKVLTTQYEVVTIESDNVNWFIVAN